MVPLLTALVAFLLGFFSASYFAIKSAEVAAINDHIEDLKQIEALATSYWLGECDGEKELETTAHRLRGKLHAAGLFRGRSEAVLGYRAREYGELDDDLFDIATGGTFQTASYAPDPVRAGQVMVTCNSMRALLRGVRKHIYWAH